MDETERLTEFKEHHWDMLLDYIGQGRVVPVIGPELLVAAEDGRNVPFYRAVSRRLARHFDMPEVEGETLSDLLSRFLKSNNTVKMARTGLIKVLKELEDQPQPSLQRLASVNAFRLFLTTTPDALLAKALADSGTDSEVYLLQLSTAKMEI